MQIFPSKSECLIQKVFSTHKLMSHSVLNAAPAKKYAHFRTVMKRTIQRQHMQSSIKTLILALQAAAVLHL